MYCIKYKSGPMYIWYYINYKGGMRTVRRKRGTLDYENMIDYMKDPDYWIAQGVEPMNKYELLDMSHWDKLFIKRFY